MKQSNTSSAQTELTGRIDLSTESGEQIEEVSLKEAESLPDTLSINPVEDTSFPIIAQQPESSDGKKPRSSAKWWLLGLLLVLGLGAVELVLFTQLVFEQQDLLGGLWLAVLVLIVTLAAVEVVKQWFGLKRLKRQEQDKARARQIFESPAIGTGEAFCVELAKGLPASSKSRLAEWKSEIDAHHNDKEILALFENKVLVPADNSALQQISRHASAAGAMIAVSPFALLDMAIVLWRNFKMMNQISQTYGVKLSYWGRISLVRKVFKTMLYAGASEIIADAGNYAMGAGLAGKLSTRVAQGMSAGVLTARIGVKTMQACRPVPWLTVKPPGISDMTSTLLEDLTKLIK